MSRKREDNLEVILCTEHKMSTFVVTDFGLLCRERGVVEKDRFTPTELFSGPTGLVSGSNPVEAQKVRPFKD